MKHTFLSRTGKALCAVALLAGLLASCHTATTTMTDEAAAQVRSAVQKMADSLVIDLSREGPSAWMKYFEHTPGFYMASEGKLAFPDIDSASVFINTVLVRNIHGIQLRWSGLRIDPYTPGLAGMAATFHEDLTDAAGNTIPQDGYFSGTAEKTATGWQLRNAHWSIKAGK